MCIRLENLDYLTDFVAFNICLKPKNHGSLFNTYFKELSVINGFILVSIRNQSKYLKTLN